MKSIQKCFDEAIDNQTNEFARNILYTNLMYLKASTDVRISILLEKNGICKINITYNFSTLCVKKWIQKYEE